ncbi:LPS translocon maturation chaperone LptM [Acidovorax sp. RAC01]|uniref:LPS translocon maturation chaperone LptM n=1 Tax=Acidovorax sp. RAC01 TaxID=1842533 RepID=UPI0009F66133|nr:lipoprotein [Acidovorax sp. RAC01]
MLKASGILVRTIVLMAASVALHGCGQRGPLYLPTATQVPQRASLPQALLPVASDNTAPSENTRPGSKRP